MLAWYFAINSLNAASDSFSTKSVVRIGCRNARTVYSALPISGKASCGRPWHYIDLA